MHSLTWAARCHDFCMLAPCTTEPHARGCCPHRRNNTVEPAVLDKEFWEQFATLFSSQDLLDAWALKFKSVLNFRNVDR